MGKSKAATRLKQEALTFDGGAKPAAPKRTKRANDKVSSAAADRAGHWKDLLSTARLEGDSAQDVRPAFEHDYDRIIFSSHFRRLADKTQVFPLSHTDNTRTRLTHSLETASIGRSLGTLAGEHLAHASLLPEGLVSASIGTLVAAACLAHDIGNPPFGHAGEEAVRRWATSYLGEARGLTPREVKDFIHFEGNAQGFRILVRLFAPYRTGGMRPSLALCGTVSKYTCTAEGISEATPWTKKNGYFVDDESSATQSFTSLGLLKQSKSIRHPLAFLTEAADDIAYRVIDLEDTYKIGAIPFAKAHELLSAIATKSTQFKEDTSAPHDARIERLRAAAVSVLVTSCFRQFTANLIEIEEGRFMSSLLNASEYSNEAKALKNTAMEHGYQHPRVLQIEAAGFVALNGLLDAFVDAANSTTTDAARRGLRKLLPEQFRYRPGLKSEARPVAFDDLRPYLRVLAVTDYVSGMTDSFAVDLYQKAFRNSFAGLNKHVILDRYNVISSAKS